MHHQINFALILCGIFLAFQLIGWSLSYLAWVNIFSWRRKSFKSNCSVLSQLDTGESRSSPDMSLCSQQSTYLQNTQWRFESKVLNSISEEKFKKERGGWSQLRMLSLWFCCAQSTSCPHSWSWPNIYAHTLLRWGNRTLPGAWSTSPLPSSEWVIYCSPPSLPRFPESLSPKCESLHCTSTLFWVYPSWKATVRHVIFFSFEWEILSTRRKQK